MDAGDWIALAMVLATVVSATATVYQAHATIVAARGRVPTSTEAAVKEYSSELGAPSASWWISAIAFSLIGFALIGIGLYGLDVLPGNGQPDSIAPSVRAVSVISGMLSLLPLIRLAATSNSLSLLGMSDRGVLLIFGVSVELTLLLSALGAIRTSLQDEFVFGHYDMTPARQWSLLLFAVVSLLIFFYNLRVLSVLVVHPARIVLYDLVLTGSLIVFPIALAVGIVTTPLHTADVQPSRSDQLSTPEVAAEGNDLSSEDFHAVTTHDIPMWRESSRSSDVITLAPRGTVVLVKGVSSRDFDVDLLPVEWDGLQGFMLTEYLTKTTDDLSPIGAPAIGASSEVVAYALRHLGYPYVGDTHGPSSFDAPGFTYWVIENTRGVNIGFEVWPQIAAGTPVSRADIQPGDLVFFQDTYTTELSHVGIYIGNGQFVHAENERTGVVISDLESQRYSTRWYGAVRLD